MFGAVSVQVTEPLLSVVCAAGQDVKSPVLPSVGFRSVHVTPATGRCVSGVNAWTMIVICCPGLIVRGVTVILREKCPVALLVVAVAVAPELGIGVLVFEVVACGSAVLVGLI